MHNKHDQAAVPPLDRLVQLLAEIEVARYLAEIKKEGLKRDDADHE